MVDFREADDGGEAVECAGDCVSRRGRCHGTLNGDGRGRGGDGSRGLSGKLTGGSVGREVEDLGEEDAAGVAPRVCAVVHGAVEVEDEDFWGLAEMISHERHYEESI